MILPLTVDLLPPLNEVEKANAGGDAVSLQRRSHDQTARSCGPAPVGNHEIGRERVEFPVDALHGGVKRFEVNGDITVWSHNSCFRKALGQA